MAGGPSTPKAAELYFEDDISLRNLKMDRHTDKKQQGQSFATFLLRYRET